VRTEDNAGYEPDPIGTLVEQHTAQGKSIEAIAALLPPFRAPGSQKPRRLSPSGVKRVQENLAAFRACNLRATLAARTPAIYDKEHPCPRCKDKTKPGVRKREHNWLHKERDARTEFKEWVKRESPETEFEFE